MKRLVLFLFLVVFASAIRAQQLYYPPAGNATWDTVSAQSLGWCPDKIDSLYNYLAATNTKGFIVLRGGKIVLEKYFGTFTKDSFWYWASAGKTLTSFTIGLAQEDGFLSIQDSTSKYLKSGWTSGTPAQESAIRIRHQLTMTSGLNDGVVNNKCTLPSCLQYLAPPGTRWAYHNAPYTLLQRVLDTATGSFVTYFNQKLRNPIGMNGVWVTQNVYDRVYFSTPRSMARYGLLLLGKGRWNGTAVMTDTAYLQGMMTTSQPINPSYGYLFWLNGKASFHLPGTQAGFTGPLMPHAPADMYCGLGSGGQILNVVPSQNLVLIRMGDADNDSAVTVRYNDTIWIKLNAVMCNPTAVSPPVMLPEPAVFPNPAEGRLFINGVAPADRIGVYDMQGRLLLMQAAAGASIELNIRVLAQGSYVVYITDAGGRTKKIARVVISAP